MRTIKYDILMNIIGIHMVMVLSNYVEYCVVQLDQYDIKIMVCDMPYDIYIYIYYEMMILLQSVNLQISDCLMLSIVTMFLSTDYTHNIYNSIYMIHCTDLLCVKIFM